MDSRAKVQMERQLVQPPKDKPPIEENLLFRRYHEGTLITKEPVREEPPPSLPPYPSREHAVGFWRVLQSPTGLPVEEGADASDNLVLRVDGTVSGGPILEPETRQKASGGTWRLLHGDDNKGGDDGKDGKDDDVQLRIRLVIPPTKERILVMEGRVDRAAFGDLSLARNTFGVPELEAVAGGGGGGGGAKGPRLEDLLHCAGQAWIEDAVTGANRTEVGRFSITKLKQRDPRRLTVTVPRPVGYLD
jgi:hypothetical protein